MPTVIDSLVVELGLDPKNFTKGQKEAAASFLKTRDEAVRTGKQIEDAGKVGAEFFGKLRNEAVGFFAAFMGARGLKEFVQDTTRMNAGLGRTAQLLRESPQTVSMWGGAVKTAGGSVDGIVSSMTNLTQQLEQFQATGESAVIPYFRALGISIVDSTGQVKKSSDILLELADKFRGMRPSQAAFYARALGIDEGTLNFLRQGRAAVQAMLDEQAKLLPLTKEQADAAARVQSAWAKAEKAVEGVGNQLYTTIAPGLEEIAGGVKDFALDVAKADKALNGWLLPLGAIATLFGGIKASVIAIRAALSIFGISSAAGSAAGAGIIGRLATSAFGRLLGPLGFYFGSTVEANKGEKDIYDKNGKLTEYGRRLTGQPAPTPSVSGSGAFKSQAEKEAFIRSEAAKRGIDPDIAMRVARSEGFSRFAGDQNTSFGAFQLHYKNNIPGLSNAGLGDKFTRETGLDARDPANERASIMFALDEAKRGGWGPWHGWRGAPWAGISRDDSFTRALRSLPNLPNVSSGPGGSIDNSKSSTSTTTVNVGQVNVHTQATDAAGIARDIKPALQRDTFANQANFGPN